MIHYVASLVLLASTLTGSPVADTTGTAYELSLSPAARYETTKDASWALAFSLTNTGGTSPTSEVRLEYSHDGTNWYRLASLSASASGTTATTGIVAVTVAPFKFVRAWVDVGGTAAPTSVAVRAELLCNYPFEGAAVT